MEKVRNRLIYLRTVGRDKRGEKRGLYRCTCGKETEIRESSVKSGNSKSCGCLRDELRRTRPIKHGMRNTRIYKTWCGMIERAHKQKSSRKCYQGIDVSKEWLTFENFYNDMKDGYNDTLTIDRIDNSKGYSKQNCRWATRQVQNRNKTNIRLITFQGESLCPAEWGDRVNIKSATIRARIDLYGWSVEKALTTPAKNSNVTNT